jgi:hypothetical protein
MDRKLSKTQKIEQLIRLGDAARVCLNAEALALKQRLDVPSRIRDSLKTNPTGWLVGSLASGFVASLFLRRSRPVARETKQRGLLLTLLGLALTAARPLASVWLSGQVKNYLAGHPSLFSGNRSGNPSHQPR